MNQVMNVLKGAGDRRVPQKMLWSQGTKMGIRGGGRRLIKAPACRKNEPSLYFGKGVGGEGDDFYKSEKGLTP